MEAKQEPADVRFAHDLDQIGIGLRAREPVEQVGDMHILDKGGGNRAKIERLEPCGGSRNAGSLDGWN